MESKYFHRVKSLLYHIYESVCKTQSEGLGKHK